MTNLYDLLQGRGPGFAGREPQSQHEAAVVPVHTAVRGRVRLRVRGLYQSESLKRTLESRLAKSPGIERVAANPLTGNVLVLFADQRSTEDVVGLVEALVPRGAASLRRGVRTNQQADRRPDRRHEARPAGEVPPSPLHEWHSEDTEALLAALGSSRTWGLGRDAARDLLMRHGANRLTRAQPRSSASILLSQFRSLPTALLAGSAVLSALTGGFADAIVVLGVVALNAGIGFVTEHESERTIQSLTERAPRSALVIRDGHLEEIDAEALVPGDLLALAPGHYVPADARLLEVRSLTIDESALTGESLPVTKTANALPDPNLPIGERTNMAYMGTVVTGGNGLALVVATGRDTQIGLIQSLVGEARAPETPMQRQLEQLGNQMVWLSLGICGVVFGVGLWRRYGMLQMLKAAVSLAVAAVPEGLPTVATTTLALGIRSMRRRSVLVRQLAAVETLGAVQTICLDKTGTLTMNRMSVLALHVGDDRLRLVGDTLQGLGGRIDPHERPGLLRLLHVAALCNETEINGSAGNYVLNGSATESALVELGLRTGVDVAALRIRHPRIGVQYRAEHRNYMVTVHEAGPGGSLLAVKGSPAEVLGLCRWSVVDGASVELTTERRDAILLANERMAGEALRVLGFAYAHSDEGCPSEPRELIWLGLIGMADPVRAGVKELIALFHEAGIKTVMITGDQSATAYAIGRELGLSDDRSLEILDSVELGKIDPQVLSALAQKVQIFSRVSPAHKLQIVQALQHAGKVVAMTGDGINDGPALKAADIGVAMGSGGTDVARDVADIVLEDDDLRTMIVAVSEGRTIYNNIRKSVHFLSSTNLSEIAVMLTAIASGLGQPLNAMQLLWINLLTDVFPALALAVEPPEPDVLSRPPRDPQQPIIGRREFIRYGIESLSMTAGSMAAYGYGVLRYGATPRAGTVVFNTLTAAQLLHAYSARSEHFSIFSRRRLPPNRYLHLAIGGSAALQVATLALPSLRRLLGTTTIGAADLAVIAAGAVLPFLVNEATKRQRAGATR